MTTTAPAYDLERILPDGRLLGYRDEDHSYWLDGKRIAACSTVIGTLNKYNLTKRGGWIERNAVVGTFHAMKAGELDGVPEQDMWQRVRALGYGLAKQDEGAARGTVLHSVMDRLAETGKAPNPAEVAEVARAWVRAGVKAWRSLNVTEVVEREQIVCHPEFGYAGRFDLLALTRPQPMLDPMLTLLDYKSSKDGTVWEEAHWQTRLYSMAIRETLGLEVERIVILGIGPNGELEPMECCCSEEDAVALATVYRGRARINSGMGKQRRRKA